MNDLEIIFTMLGEKVTTEITKAKDAQGFVPCKTAANEGGEVAGNARKEAEKKIGKPITSKENYLTEPEKDQADYKSAGAAKLVVLQQKRRKQLK